MNMTHIKTICLLTLLAFFSFVANAQVLKTIENPDFMVASGIRDAKLEIEKVEFCKESTKIYFKSTSSDFLSIGIHCRLVDIDGNEYMMTSNAFAVRLLSMKPKHFMLEFEPMPKNVKMFDLIGGLSPQFNSVIGIHDRKEKLSYPQLSDILKNNTCVIPDNWLKTDTAYINIKFGECNIPVANQVYTHYFYDELIKTLPFEVTSDADGSVRMKFLAAHPSIDVLSPNRIRNLGIPFFFIPGQTTEITVNQEKNGVLHFTYGGVAAQLQRYLNSNIMLREIGSYRILSVKGKVAELVKEMDKVWNDLMLRISIVAKRDNFTPIEVQMAVADAQIAMLYGLTDYFHFCQDNYSSVVPDDNGKLFRDITDTVEYAAIKNFDNYRIFEKMDFNNKFMACVDEFGTVISRLTTGMNPISHNLDWGRRYAGVEDQIAYINDEINCLQKFLHTNGHSFLAQAAIVAYYSSMIMIMDKDQLDSIFTYLISTFTDDYLKTCIKNVCDEKINTPKVLPLPQGESMAVIDSILNVYQGKYVCFDFWADWCGPCVNGIKSSVDARKEIAKRNDVKLVFIAQQDNQATREIVDNYLEGETVIYAGVDRFKDLQYNLLHFAGIPHIEVITPDRKRVNESLVMYGFSNFDEEFNDLKSQLE